MSDILLRPKDIEDRVRGLLVLAMMMPDDDYRHGLRDGLYALLLSCGASVPEDVVNVLGVLKR